MKKYSLGKLLLFLLVLTPLLARAEDPVDDKLIGTVHIKSNMKLDAQARKEIATAAARIKKGKAGTVKLRGSYPAAATADEYLSKSVFMAREVEQYLKKLLPAKQQVFTMFSPFSDESRQGENIVEIFLYPLELKAADFEGFRVNTVEGKPVIQQLSGDQAVPQVPVHQTAGQPADEGKAVRPVKVRPEPPEDVNRAEELVRRAKERAANRAKRKDGAE